MSAPDRFDWHSNWGDLISQTKPEIPEHADNYAWSEYASQAFYQLARNKEPNDCAVRALAVACAAPYERAYNAMEVAGRLAGESATTSMMMYAATFLNRNMVQLLKRPGRTLRTAERALKDTHGGFILLTCNHAVGIWDGELIDHARGRLWRVTTVYRVERRKQL